MCDYSLEMYKNRAAEDNEDLVVKRFPSGSQGFVSEKDADCAVCCVNGVKMLVHFGANDYPVRPLVEHSSAIYARLEGEVEVTFHTLPLIHEARSYRTYRDGFILPDGMFLLMQFVPAGTRATVTKALPKEIAEAAAAPVAFREELRVADVVDFMPLATI